MEDETLEVLREIKDILEPFPTLTAVSLLEKILDRLTEIRDVTDRLAGMESKIEAIESVLIEIRGDVSSIEMKG